MSELCPTSSSHVASEQIKPYLLWLKKRLENKYQESNKILETIDFIVDDHTILPKIIPQHHIDEICRQHYTDFDMSPCELNLGYTEAQRQDIRIFINSIISLASKL